jgi:hypothetical protein
MGIGLLVVNNAAERGSQNGPFLASRSPLQALKDGARWLMHK